MQYGYFDDEHREYIIERPDTPLPWFNYLGCEQYFGLISNTAGGYSFYRDARLRRLTRYRYNNAPLDIGGRYIYIRDQVSGSFWSPSWQPVREELDEYQCRHGLGYTTIMGKKAGIRSSTSYFVPLGQNLEVWKLSITNERTIPAALNVFGSVEFCLWDALDDATNFQRNYSVGEVEVEDEVIYHKTEYRERRNHYAFLACSEPIIGYDTQREGFLGPYRGWDHPLAVETGKCSNTIALGWAPVGVQQIEINLKPGETKTILFLLGYQENDPADKFEPRGTNRIKKEGTIKVIHEYMNIERVDQAFAELKTYWGHILGTFQVQTPDIHTNRMVNIWNAYQCMVTFNISRSASGFETGIGRGMGFRDSNQDLLGFVQMVPEKARERILDLAATQLENGGAYHQYQPLTKRGNDGVGSNFNDDPLWLILAAAAYIKETGDWGILDEVVPYDNKPELAAPFSNHLERSIEYVLARIGPHGLPLIGRADWNDCLNLNCFSSEPGQSFQTTTNKDGKVAESVMIAGLFVQAAAAMAEMAGHLGKTGDRDKYILAKEKIENIVLGPAGWDGKWFRRAYNDFGKPVGSDECKEGKIFIEPQGICIMAGIGIQDGKAQQALDQVHDWLATPHGIVLHQPAFTHYYLEMGEITSYPPGYKENAGVFCHTNPWVMIAETMVGDGNRAFDYYTRINPSYRENISEVHRCEPYVYAQMIAGKDAPYPGEAKNSWLTGTAAWNYVAITQWILGIRPTYDGLEVSPCIPDDWQDFAASREYRGNTYQIQVKRIKPGSSISLTVDDHPIEGTIIPIPEGEKKTIHVLVELG
jgi:cellobiose phosphorylase